MKVRTAPPNALRPTVCRRARSVERASRPATAYLVRAVYATEAALRNLVQSLKMNLASLGNVVPHVRRHMDLRVIARCADDSHFAQVVRGERQRGDAAQALLEGSEEALAARLAGELGAPA